MSNIIVRSSSGGLAVNNGPSVLGEQQASIPVGGKVRPGIKVLTSNAANNQEAKRIYDEGVAAGQKWGAIEKAIMQKCGLQKQPLTPRNTQYFSVFRDDFTNPAMADRMLELYGEPLDGKTRLLRFPVIFPTDSWQANLPHALQCFTASELKYWSDYDADGTRRCFTRLAASVNGQNRRATRTFGGRQKVLRPDNQGICDPEKCPQYQSSSCNLKGNLLFFVPGITGSGAISLPLTSFYGMEQARKTMAMVAFLRGGRISGTHDGQPIFYITKTQQSVSMLDRETGAPKKVSHWIVTLEADIDMLQVFKAAESRLLNSAAAADAALALSSPEHHDDYEDDDNDALEGELEPALDGEPEIDPHQLILSRRQAVNDLIKTVGVDTIVFSNWMVETSGIVNWGRDLEGLQQAMDHLEEALETGADQWLADRNLNAPF